MNRKDSIAQKRWEFINSIIDALAYVPDAVPLIAVLGVVHETGGSPKIATTAITSDGVSDEDRILILTAIEEHIVSLKQKHKQEKEPHEH